MCLEKGREGGREAEGEREIDGGESRREAEGESEREREMEGRAERETGKREGGRSACK